MGVNVGIRGLAFRQGCVWVSFSHVLHESTIHPKYDQHPNFTDSDNQGKIPNGSIIDRDNQVSLILIITDTC